jgi:hypothetical protein
MSDPDLGRLVVEDLGRSGLPVAARVLNTASRRLPQAYPIYLEGYQEPFDRLDRWFDGLPNALTFGRQGLFAHDNTHHALAMAYRAVDCLGPAGFDGAAWRKAREVFATHVVED